MATFSLNFLRKSANQVIEGIGPILLFGSVSAPCPPELFKQQEISRLILSADKTNRGNHCRLVPMIIFKLIQIAEKLGGLYDTPQTNYNYCLTKQKLIAQILK
jgi:hypothetical protein